jgi:EmrB/QacA subfamily drug resistance transporter
MFKLKGITMKNNSPWLVLLGISLASFLGCIDFTIVNTALPAIQSNLGAQVTQLQWIINAFMLAVAASMVIGGRLADLYGRRLWLYVGMAIFGLASLGAGLSPNINFLIGFRALQGIGVALLYTVPVSIVTHAFPDATRGKATGILVGVNGFGLAIGPVIGGILVSAIGWRWIFLVNIPIILASIFICTKSLVESRSNEENAKIDWPGFILLLIGSPALIFATAQGSIWGWSSLPVLSLYAIAVISLLAFYFIEQKSTSPIIQFHLFTNRTFIAGLIANFALAFYYCIAFFLIPLYLHTVRGEEAYTIGLMLLPITLLVAILSPLVGGAVDKFGAKMVLLVGFSFFALSAILQHFFTEISPLMLIMVAFVCMGIGWACILSPSIVATLSSVPQNNSGVAMGSLGTLHNFGGALGLALGTLVYSAFAQKNLLAQGLTLKISAAQLVSDPENALHTLSAQTVKQFFLYGYHGAMSLLFVISILAFLLVLFGMGRVKTQHSPEYLML